jgi:hypothetical protein
MKNSPALRNKEQGYLFALMSYAFLLTFRARRQFITLWPG